VNPLVQLKDIHNPASIPFWPLAPGWYFLVGIVVVLCAIGSYAFYRYRKFFFVSNFVLMRLQQLRNEAERHPGGKIIRELSVLLRRVALIKYSRYKVAGLQGDAWLEFLDKAANTTLFVNGVGRVLATAPYQKNPVVNYSELFDLVEKAFLQLVLNTGSSGVLRPSSSGVLRPSSSGVLRPSSSGVLRPSSSGVLRPSSSAKAEDPGK